MGASQEQVKVWRPEGFEGLELEKFENVPSLCYPPFVLQTYDLTVATGGGTTVHYAGSKYDFANLDFTFFAENPGEVFANDPHNGFFGPSSMWNIRITEEGMRSLLQNFGKKHPTPYFPNMLVPGKLNNPLARLTVETVRTFDEPASHLERESHLLTLVSEVIRHCADDPPSEPRLGKEHRAVGLIKDFLRDHYREDITLDDLAKLAGLNKTYLLEVFKRDVGLSPHEYLTGTRVHKAKTLLSQGLPIAQVAYDTGFVDQSHLHRTFKKYVLVTPGQYQRDSLPSDRRSWRLGMGR